MSVRLSVSVLVYVCMYASVSSTSEHFKRPCQTNDVRCQWSVLIASSHGVAQMCLDLIHGYLWQQVSPVRIWPVMSALLYVRGAWNALAVYDMRYVVVRG